MTGFSPVRVARAPRDPVVESASARRSRRSPVWRWSGPVSVVVPAALNVALRVRRTGHEPSTPSADSLRFRISLRGQLRARGGDRLRAQSLRDGGTGERVV